MAGAGEGNRSVNPEEYVMKKILVATDGSDHALRAVQLAGDIAGKYDAEVIALHVNDNRDLSEAECHMAEVEYGDEIGKRLGDMLDAERGAGRLGLHAAVSKNAALSPAIRSVLSQQIVERAREVAAEAGATSVRTIERQGDAADTIVDVAKSEGANLIVLGSRGLGGLRSLILGSVSQKVANEADANVITVK